MGQQQLMLVLLVVIVVGIATVVAINVFSSGASQANKDAIRQNLLDAALSAQTIYDKPVMFGGAGQNFSLAENGGNQRLTELIRIPGTREGNVITNANAIYTISGDAETLTINVDPQGSSGEWTLTMVRQESNNWLTTVVDGDGNTTIMGLEDEE